MLAMDFMTSQHENGANQKETNDNNSNFILSLTYLDVDKDTATISSTEELVDAIEQFVNDEAKSMKINVMLRRKHAAKTLPKGTQTPTGRTSMMAPGAAVVDLFKPPPPFNFNGEESWSLPEIHLERIVKSFD